MCRICVYVYGCMCVMCTYMCVCVKGVSLHILMLYILSSSHHGQEQSHPYSPEECLLSACPHHAVRRCWGSGFLLYWLYGTHTEL